MKVTIFVLATVAIAFAEPPAPNSNYLPSNQYSTTSQDNFAPPSNQYGAPSRPSSNYGAPSGGSRPSQNYGAPSGGGGSAPSQNYGAPSSNYGAPSYQQTTAVIRPNTQYGAPSNNGGNDGYASNGGYADNGPSEPANYNFKYDVQDEASGNDFGHEESRQGDVAKGKYYVLLPDGRRQVVEYTADNEGYKPKISYEQVGGGYQNGGYPSGNGNGNGNGNGGYKY